LKPYYDKGGITIYCADYKDVLPVSADVVITDPPYINQSNDWFTLAGCDRVVFTPGIDNIGIYPQPKWVLCWHKPSGISYSRVGGFNQWEPVYVYGNKYKFGQDYFYQIPLNFSQGPERQHIHPKPISLWSWLIQGSSNEGETILDPFLGSGTTAVCAKKLGRKCTGIEISEKYCEIAVKRLAQEVMELGV